MYSYKDQWLLHAFVGCETVCRDFAIPSSGVVAWQADRPCLSKEWVWQSETAVRPHASWALAGSFTTASRAEEVRRRPIGNRAVCIKVALARTTNPSVDNDVPVPLGTLGPATIFTGARFVLVNMQKLGSIDVLVDDRV